MYQVVRKVGKWESGGGSFPTLINSVDRQERKERRKKEKRNRKRKRKGKREKKKKKKRIGECVKQKREKKKGTTLPFTISG